VGFDDNKMKKIETAIQVGVPVHLNNEAGKWPWSLMKACAVKQHTGCHRRHCQDEGFCSECLSKLSIAV
jgi:hypothetical protein